MTKETAASKLRDAAVKWVQGSHYKPVDAKDSAFVKLDKRLLRAALTYAKVVRGGD